MASDPSSNNNSSTTDASSRTRGPSVSSSSTQPGYAHRPSQPSLLRQTFMPPDSPEEHTHIHPEFDQDRILPASHENATTDPDIEATHQKGTIDEPPDVPNVRTRLLDQFKTGRSGEGIFNHGTFSKRAKLSRNYDSFNSDAGSLLQSPTLVGPIPDSEEIHGEAGSYSNNPLTNSLGDSITDGLLGRPKKTSMTHWLAERAGIKHERLMYIYYYVPFFNWIRQYRWSFLKGDLIGALTMASFYIPTALSYASNLGHMPPINGLYAFVFNPLFYAFLGTCPQMVVGPEAAGSLLTGSVVTEAIKAGHFSETNGVKAAQVGGMVTGLAGGIILIAGICRLGFLDSVLSRPFLRGFISSIGLVILISQLMPEMGLDKAAEHSQRASHGSPLEQIMFLIDHGHEAHKLTCAVSFGTVAIVLTLRELKRRLSPVPKLSWVVFVPDRFLVVVLSAVFAWKFDWQGKGIEIMGEIKSPNGKVFEPHFPFASDNFKHVNDAFQTAFIIALLGFFESCVAAKSLGIGTGKTEIVEKKNKDGTIKEVEQAQGIRNMTVSANRELVALGVANVIGGVFMALPAFGGYGRSKVNKSTGGKTPMSSIFLSLITAICVLYLLPYFHYIPKGVLSAMITVVSISLLEEAPHDIHFFWCVRGWVELFLMTLIFLTTFFWSLRGGIIVGLIFSLIRLLRHTARPRIQILGRVPGTDHFDNVEYLAQEGAVETIPHCLIVKIPEPLTFANTGSLKDRLKRLEDHGTARAHPALPSVRARQHNKNVIFDIHGVTRMDTAAAQVLLEIVTDYHDRGTRVLFCRIPSRHSDVWDLMRLSGIVELVGGEGAFLRNVAEALRATEKESTFREYMEERDGSERRPSERGGYEGEDEEDVDRRNSAFAPDEGGPSRGGLRQRDSAGREESGSLS